MRSDDAECRGVFVNCTEPSDFFRAGLPANPAGNVIGTFNWLILKVKSRERSLNRGDYAGSRRAQRHRQEVRRRFCRTRGRREILLPGLAKINAYFYEAGHLLRFKKKLKSVYIHRVKNVLYILNFIFVCTACSEIKLLFIIPFRDS